MDIKLKFSSYLFILYHVAAGNLVGFFFNLGGRRHCVFPQYWQEKDLSDRFTTHRDNNTERLEEVHYETHTSVTDRQGRWTDTGYQSEDTTVCDLKGISTFLLHKTGVRNTVHRSSNTCKVTEYNCTKLSGGCSSFHPKSILRSRTTGHDVYHTHLAGLN